MVAAGLLRVLGLFDVLQFSKQKNKKREGDAKVQFSRIRTLKQGFLKLSMQLYFTSNISWKLLRQLNDTFPHDCPKFPHNILNKMGSVRRLQVVRWGLKVYLFFRCSKKN